MGEHCDAEPGAFVTDIEGFFPGLQITIPTGWFFTEQDSGELSLHPVDDPDKTVALFKDVRVIATTRDAGPRNMIVESVARTPEAFVEWFTNNEAFTVVETPRAATIAGTTGTVFGIAVSEAANYGDPECLVTLGCWGPVVQCNIVSRGAIGSAGGCMNTGGICIGCTMPGFPDAFAPFYKAPPGKTLSATASRMVGSFIGPLRRITQRGDNFTGRWMKTGHVPSGWGHVIPPGPVFKAVHRFYRKLQYSGPYSPASKRQQQLQASAHSFIGESKRKIEEEQSV